jgi:N-acetylneuraminic acid mutarotase
MSRRLAERAVAAGLALLVAASCTSPAPPTVSGGPSPTSRPRRTAIATPAGSPTLGVTGSGTWSEAAPMPKPISEAATATTLGRIYVAGGIEPVPYPVYYSSSRTFQIYDVAAHRWRLGPDLPQERDHLALAGLEGKIYLTGGGRWGLGGGSFDELWVYDPATDAWSTRARMPAKRHAHAMVALDGRLYVVGGVIFPPERAGELWVYDPRTDRWTVAPTKLPTLREHVTAVAAAGKIYVIGGRWQGNVAALESYDPTTNRWQHLPDMPSARSGLTSGAIRNEIHVTGGEDPNSNRAFPEHEVFNLRSGTWSRFPDLPLPRHGVGSAVVDGRWYVTGGSQTPGTGESDTVYVFTP